MTWEMNTSHTGDKIWLQLLSYVSSINHIIWYDAVFPTDWEGRPLSEANQLTLRFGCQSVRLVRKHGEDHEGTGLPDRKRHFHKVSNDLLLFSDVNAHYHGCKMQMQNTLWPAWLFTEFIWQFLSSLSFSYYASQKKTLEINPKHPLIKEMLNRVNVSLMPYYLTYKCFINVFFFFLLPKSNKCSFTSTFLNIKWTNRSW